MEQKSVALTERHWQAIVAEARRLGVSLADVIRRVLDDWMDKPRHKG